MRRHMWIHIGLLIAVVAVLGSRAAGVGVPTAIVYLVVLACPLMMIVMMLGMQNHATGSGHDHNSGVDDPPSPPPEPSSSDVSR